MGIKELGEAALKLIGVDPVAILEKGAEIADRFIQSPDEKAAFKMELLKMQNEMQKEAYEREIAFRQAAAEEYKAEVEDRNGARAMKQSWIQPALAVAVVGAYFGFSIFLLFFLKNANMDEMSKNIMFAMFQAAGNMAMLVLAFYFGSSSGSQQKNDIIRVQQAAQGIKPKE